jgi:hypothetical protein
VEGSAVVAEVAGLVNIDGHLAATPPPPSQAKAAGAGSIPRHGSCVC